MNKIDAPPLHSTPTQAAAQGFAFMARETLHQAHRYSMFVHVMKRALPLLAGAVAASVIVYSLQPRENARPAVTFEKVGLIANDLAMTHPRLTGVDNAGLPFTITAESAVQEAADLVQLNVIEAKLALSGGGTLTLTAPNGRVRPKQSDIEVDNGINLVTDTGFSAVTDAVKFNFKTGFLEGSTPIQVVAPFGRITADRFTIMNATKEVRFSGHVHMFLNKAPEGKAMPVQIADGVPVPKIRPQQQERSPK